MHGQWRVAGALAAISLLAGLGQPVRAVPLTSPPRTVVVASQLPPAPPAGRLPVDPGTPRAKRPPRAGDTRRPRVDCAKRKCVALTLDDGPVAGTAKLLALLRRKRVHVTFFVLGTQAKAHPAILRRMVADGHVIGNHSWNHPQFWHLSGRAIRSQLRRTDAVVRRITGKRPTLVRPPFGQLDRTVHAIARKRGDALVLWDVDPMDWKKHDASVVAKRVVRHARRGSIILTHDVWPTTRHAYRRIIDGLRAKGFTLVTVPQLLGSRSRPGRAYFRR